MPWRWALLWTMCLLAGCSRGTANTAPVVGLVLFNGLPARAAITSQAVNDLGQPNGRPSNADTRPDGTYSLTYSENQSGALVGKQRVTVTVYPVERAADELSFQERFKATKVVKLTREVVPSQTNRWNFVLKY